VHDLGKFFMNACWHVDACCEMIFFLFPMNASRGCMLWDKVFFFFFFFGCMLACKCME
jgi:hypothetical protein